MNSRDMQKAVLQQLDAMKGITVPSEDVMHYLNRAQDVFIEEQYVLVRGKYTDNQNIELYSEAQKALENLRTVLTTELTTNANLTDSNYIDNAKEFVLSNLSNDFYFYVRSQSRVSDGGKWVNNKLITQEKVQDYIRTRDNSPVFRDFLVLLEGNKMYVIYDDQINSDVYDVALTYIKRPDTLVLESPGAGEAQTSEFPVHTHQDIVDIAVDLIRRDKTTSNPRIQESE